MVLEDSCGRPLTNLRVAITKRCNLKCVYCHGEGEEKRSDYDSAEMTANEIIRIVRVAASLGIQKVKLTGGEPLIRMDIMRIVNGISTTSGLKDLSMTTNGTLLPSLAEKLYLSGLNRINISIPTLQEETYHSLTQGEVQNVLNGVRAAVGVGFYPVKLNMLVLKSINDHTVFEMIKFARETKTILQLIELEPLNISNGFYSANHKSLDKYEKLLKHSAEKVETRPHMHNRRVYHLPDVKVEVIRPIQNNEFCMHCTRLRVTSDGKLKPCLMRSDNYIDILTPMRSGASDEELITLFELATQRREPYYKD
jgi:cyclic pyranopterin phosphate synthase